MNYRTIGICLAWVFLLFIGDLQAQKLSRLSAGFIRDGKELRNPLVGGLNAPQFNEIDLNNDGVLDLLIFDRVGSMCLPYLNRGTADEIDYDFAPQFCFDFPDIKDWVSVRDYNGDGVMDLFTESSVPGIKGVQVYQGFYSDGRIKFRKMKTPLGPEDILYFRQTNGGITNINVFDGDYPAIEDIDGDGDIDILTFNVAGGYVEYFINESVERGFSLDSLYYKIGDSCWGKFFESGVSGCADLSDSPNGCFMEFTGGDIGANYRHPGSTLLAIDIDGDEDKDLLLGDISFDNIILLQNGGNKDQAWMTSQDCAFPSYDDSIKINIYPATFYVDVDNDDKKDLLVSPNTDNNEDFNNVLFYKNLGTTEVPDFDLQIRNLFVDEMVDMGTGAHPVFVDYDADGLMDIVVGNGKFYLPLGEEDPRLFLYRNIGTATAPKFELIDDDWLNFSQLVGSNNFNLAPAFGDLDNDGDLDLLVGEVSGKLFFAPNNAGPGQPMLFGSVNFFYMDIDATTAATPYIVDVNRDGLMDILIGQRGDNFIDPNDPDSKTGNINYFQNIGTTGNPMFDPDVNNAPNNKIFGEVSTFNPLTARGNSSPVLVDFDGDYKLFTGSASGEIQLYGNIDGNLDGAFDLIDDDYGQIVAGEETHLDFADINDDGVYDIVVGNRRGGIMLYNSSFNIDGTSSTSSVDPNSQIKIAPNPAFDRLRIELPEDGTSDAEFRIFGLAGQQLITGQTLGYQTTIDITTLSAGIYFVQVMIGARIYVEKLIVK